MNLRERMAAADVAIFDRLADDALIDGQPVRGMFSAPWLAPAIGKLKTSLREPHLVVRDADALPVKLGSLVDVQGQGSFEVVCLEPDGTGLTALVLREA